MGDDSRPCKRRKKVVVLGGVHGNERVGVRVIQRLVQDISSGKVELRMRDPGCELVLGLGNPAAIELDSRGATPTADLNRSFTTEVLSAPEDALVPDTAPWGIEHRRARELAPLLEDCDIFVDLHATNTPSPPFVRIPGRCTQKQLEIASWFSHLAHQGEPRRDVDGRVDLRDVPATKMSVVLDPVFTIGQGTICTTDEFVQRHGGFAVCVETGLASDTTMEDAVYKSVLSLLRFEFETLGAHVEVQRSVLVPDSRLLSMQLGRWWDLDTNGTSHAARQTEKLARASDEVSHVRGSRKASAVRASPRPREPLALANDWSSEKWKRETDVLRSRPFRPDLDLYVSGPGFPFLPRFAQLFEGILLTKVVTLQSDRFRWLVSDEESPGTGTGSVSNLMEVTAGTVIGEHLERDQVAGSGSPVAVEEDSVLIFPKVAEVLQVRGRPVVWLGRKVKLDHAALVRHPAVPDALIQCDTNHVSTSLFQQKWRRYAQANNATIIASFSGTVGFLERFTMRPGARAVPRRAIGVDGTQHVSDSRFLATPLEGLLKDIDMQSTNRSFTYRRQNETPWLKVRESLSRMVLARSRSRFSKSPEDAKRMFAGLPPRLREVLYMHDGADLPIPVYPVLFTSKHGIHSIARSDTFYSATLVAPFTVRVLDSGTRLERFAWDSFANAEVSSQVEWIVPVPETCYVTQTPIAPGPGPSTELVVSGSSKDDVGETFVELARALLALDGASVDSPQSSRIRELHPSFLRRSGRGDASVVITRHVGNYWPVLSTHSEDADEIGDEFEIDGSWDVAFAEDTDADDGEHDSP